jgi:hypothetical protein
MLVEQLLLFLIVCGNSIEIMRDICEKFGGWLDENDCDDEGVFKT